MNARLYLNSSSLAWSERIDGGAFSPPTVRAYGDILLRFRLARDIEGQAVPDPRAVTAVSCRIGYQDAQPESGTYKLYFAVGADNDETAAIDFDATAAELKTIIDAALTGGPLTALQPVTVTLDGDDYRIVFANTATVVTVTASMNQLWPLSFVEADTIDFDNGWATILSLRQAPVAEADLATAVVPGEPTITEIQAGSTVDEVQVNEVQKILLSPDYAGATFRFVRGGIKSDLLPGFPSVEEIQAALDPLVDEGGTFFLVPVEDGVLVEFRGDMAGIDHDLITVEEFTAPPTEYLVELSTATAAMRALMRGITDTSGEVELPIDLVVTVTDDDAPSGTQDIFFPNAITFSRPISDDTRNVSAALDWTQPLSRRSNLKFSTDSVLVGNRALRYSIGDAAATSFTLTHNLGSISANFTAVAATDICTSTGHNLHNGDPVTLSSTTTLPAGLSTGTTYWVISATTDTFQLSATPGGSAVNITSTGTGTHSFLVADGTVDAVFVEVWEKAGGKTRLSPEDYTAVRTTANSLTLSGFAATPTLNQYEVIIMTAGRPATYQSHTHTIGEVTGLQTALDALSDRVTALEALAPGALQATSSSSGTGTTISQLLVPVWNVLRSRTLPAQPLTLLGWDPYTLDSPLRASRLLPAVHDNATEALPAAPLPAAAAAYVGKVFTTAADRTDFPGGTLKIGDFAACDGREWYRVTYESGSGSSYYPTPYDFELFRVPVNDAQFVLSSTLELLFGFELALFTGTRNTRDRRSACTWTLKLELGEWTGDTTPGTPGVNLDTFFTDPIIVVEQRIHVTESPSQHRFGVRITRDAANAFEVTPISYRKELAVVTDPDSANLVIRARLCRFDTEDTPSDAKGLIAVRGLDIGLDGQVDPALGKLTIT